MARHIRLSWSSIPVRGIALPLLVLVLVLIPLTPTAHAVNIITVTSTADNTTATDGDCTLREAIYNANNNADLTLGDCQAGSGSDIIVFDLAPYPRTITLGSTLPEVTADLTVTGPGADKLTISGNDTRRVLELDAETDLTLENLTIADGFHQEDGAGIHCRREFSDGPGALTITGCVFSGNRSVGGGAAEHRGAAVYFEQNEASTLTISDSTFSYNEAHSNAAVGGAIYAYATVEIANSTFVGNQTTPVAGWGLGSAIYLVGGSLNMTHCTVYDNTASSDPDTSGGTGAIHVSSGTGTLKNTIVASNPGGNCGPHNIADDGGNLQYGDTTCGAHVPVADPKLLPLAGNGGPTPTMALPIDSPAVDACACTASEGSAGSTGASLSTDQRGMSRPFDYLSVDNGDACDIGAYESGTRLYLPITRKASD